LSSTGSETLALLQRDAKTLERAFEQAGLKSSEGGIDLTLRDPSGDARGQQRDGRSHQGADPPRPSTQPDADETAPARVLRTLWAPTGRLDLHI
jgi:flagellar hook-length control protein FliK